MLLNGLAIRFWNGDIIPSNIRLVKEHRRKRQTHYAISIKDDWEYLLCGGLDTFGKYDSASQELGINCKKCHKIQEKRNYSFS